MKAEEKVKQVYPEAEAVWTGGGWRVLSSNGEDSRIIGRTESGHVLEDVAWADAWQRIQAEMSEKRGGTR